MNGLPTRGDNEITDFENGEIDGGLFLSCLDDLLFEINPKLKEIASRLPKNAKCTSPQFQNEVIETLAELVKGRIAKECRASQLYTVILDGTEDLNHDEMEAVVLRYWLNNRYITKYSRYIFKQSPGTSEAYLCTTLIKTPLIKTPFNVLSLLQEVWLVN